MPMLPTAVTRRLMTDKKRLTARWLEELRRPAQTKQIRTETPLEYHQRGLESLLSILIDRLKSDRSARLSDYLQTLIVKGFLSDYPINRLVEIFQHLQRILVAETREQFPGEEGRQAASVIRDLVDEMILDCCRHYEHRATQAGGRVEEFFEKTNLINFFLDISGNILQINSIAVEALGVDPEAVVGANFSRYVWPKDLPTYIRILGFALQGDPQICDLRVRFSGDELAYLSVTMSSVATEGKIAGIRVLATDVTEERKLQERLTRSEEKYRKLIENANDAIFLFRLEDGLVVDSNFQARELTGFDRGALFKMSVQDLVFQEDHKLVIDLIQETIAEGSSKVDGIRLRTKEDKHTKVEISSNVIEYGETRVIQSILRDMTQHDHLEKSLRERTRDLDQMYQRFGQAEEKILAIERSFLLEVGLVPFIAETGSQFEKLTNQLDSLRAEVGDIRAALPGERSESGVENTAARLELIEQNLERLNENLANLRRISKNLMTDPEVEKTQSGRIDLNQIIQEMLEYHLFRFRENATVSKKLGRIETMNGHARLVRQIVYLALRASFNMANQDGRIVVRSMNSEGKVLMDLSDNAPALNQKAIRRILDPYTVVRIDGRGPVHDLKLCRQLLSWINGSLTVSSGISRGNRMICEFPLEATEVNRRTVAEGLRYDLLVVDKVGS